MSDYYSVKEKQNTEEHIEGVSGMPRAAVKARRRFEGAVGGEEQRSMQMTYSLHHHNTSPYELQECI